MPKSRSTTSCSSTTGNARSRQSPLSSRSSHHSSNNAQPSSHWQSHSSQRRTTINPGASIETSATPRSVTPASHAPNHIDRGNTEELLDHVIVAVDIKEMGIVGCAYYVAREEILFCMEDLPRGGVESIELRMWFTEVLRPSVTLLICCSED
jgi:enterochelin esterase-like enzyme